MPVYPNLKLKLWSTGLRQNRLAQLLGMDESLLSKVINGFREANPETRKRIAVLLKADEDWLFQKQGADVELKSRDHSGR